MQSLCDRQRRVDRQPPGLLLIAGLALALRLPELDRRPMHNDEGVNAMRFRSLWASNTYQYDLANNLNGHDNTAVGFLALLNNKGSSNIGLGSNAGANLTTGNNNIDIGANVLGPAGDANTIRIGKQGTQKSTFVAGIFGTAVSGNTVVVNSNGKLWVATSSARFKEAITNGQGQRSDPGAETGYVPLQRGD